MPHLRLISLAVTLALPTLALAQDDTTELDDVVVTGTRTAVSLENSLVPVQVIDRADIDRSQANSLQDLLRGRAGINLANSGGLGKQTSLFLRGTNSSHTLVLIDGVRINSADFAAAAIADLPLAQIDRIEIMRGPNSSLYGSEAIGGVIQIFTRRNQGAYTPYFQVGGGSNGLRQGSAGFGGGGERGWFGADASYQRTDGINACRGQSFPGAGCYTEEPDRDGYRNVSASLRAGYKLTDSLTWEASALRAEGATRYDGYYNYTESVQQVLSTKLRYAPSDTFALTFNAGRNDNIADNFGPDSFGFPVFGSNATHRNTASAQADIGFGQGQLLSVGGEWYIDHLDSTTPYDVDSRRNLAGFVEYQGSFGAHRLQASARNDDNEQFGNHTTGSLGWGMDLAHGFKLSATYGTGFKAPTFSDLYDPYSGNRELAPEKSRSLNLGVAQYGTDWRWSLDAYDTRIEDLITYSGETWSMVQVDEARIRGAEFTVDVTLAGFDLSAQLSHTDPRNRSHDANQDKLLPRRARNTGRFDIDRAFGDLRVGLSVNGAGYRYDNLSNSVRLRGFATTDLRLEYAINDAWTLQAKADNVFDRHYETVAWYNQPGREYGLSLRYQPKR
jgi:vitamin B12 transporter